MSITKLRKVILHATWILALAAPGRGEQPDYFSQEIFPLQHQHVHGPTIVELPVGDLLAGWFQGSGERWADDVVIMGARRINGESEWSSPFVLADVPGFPDINPMMFLDQRRTLWLVWYTVIANQWETSLPKYRLSKDYLSPGPPNWAWQEVLHVKPGDPAERGIQPGDRFAKSLERQVADYTQYVRQSQLRGHPDSAKYESRMAAFVERTLAHGRGEDMVRRGRLYSNDGTSTEAELGYAYFRRMGWQTKNKATLIGDRIIIPLYSDGFDFSLMAFTDDFGQSWQFSEPLVGGGNIQAGIAKTKDGRLVAYMRDNGAPPQRLHVSTSADSGRTWSPVRDSKIPNSGAGSDIVTLDNGHWALLNNDTEEGRHRLALSISKDEGQTWATKYLEFDDRGQQATRSHYPAIIQGHDGWLHVVYSFHHNDREGGPNKTIKYVRVNEAWALDHEK
jgi:predicted neuraminidase